MKRNDVAYHGSWMWGALVTLTTLIIAGPVAYSQNNRTFGPATHRAPNNPASDAQDASDDHEIRAVLALDGRIDVRVEDQPLAQALQKMSEQADIPILLTSQSARYLPYGWQTRVSASIQDCTLREGLTALLRPLGFFFAATPEGIAVEPRPQLRRMGRRPTWDDLDTLAPLLRKDYSEALFDELQLQFRDIPAADGDANRRSLRERANAVGSGTMVEVLEHACDEQGWTWYPDGARIVVLPKTRQIERQLDKRISLRYTHIHLTSALADLADQAEVLIRFDPGVLADLPPQTTERFSLSIENATVRQALEVIAGETGLSYVIEQDGLRITRPPAATGVATASPDSTADVQAAVAAMRTNAIIGQLTFPMDDGTSFSLFIRENDLPHDVDTLRKGKITETINRMRHQLHRELQQD